MNRIHLLEKNVFDKIAAGEIIEGPVSVVKELLENSLDAGADMIEISIENAGMTLIRVRDNGWGIHKDDLDKAFLSHATSKIKDEDDLDRIATFGFRGEALASIAAVSDIEVISRREDDDSGHYISISESKILERGLKRHLQGTTVEVKNLFFNLPARKKFISNYNLEAAKISELISNYSLGHPHKDFILKRDGQLIIDSRGQEGWLRRTSSVFKRKTEDLVYIDKESGSIKLEGILFKPEITRNNRKSQIFFVNGRLVKSSFLSYLLDEAYENLLEKGRFPMAVLNIGIKAQMIDVNIHPAKTEIRFLEEKNLALSLKEMLKSSLIEALNPYQLPARVLDRKIENYEKKQDFYQPQKIDFTFLEETEDDKPLFVPEDEKKENWLDGLNIIGQFKNTFILAENGKDFFIIDQHVVHERILYERFTKEVNDRKIHKSTLLNPLILHLNPMEEASLIKNIISLSDLGFLIENFGPGAYLVRSLPASLEIHNPEEFFADLLEDLTRKSNLTPASLRDGLITIASCKGAIKANDRLSEEKIAYLMEELAKTDNPFTCPHGRPVFKRISINELYNFFQRGSYLD